MLNQIIIVGFVSVINLGLGFFVYLRNKKLSSNRAFLLMSISVVAWMFSSFLTDNGWSFYSKLFFGKTSFASALLIIAAILHLSKVFPLRQKYKNRDFMLLALISAVAIVTYTSMIVDSIRLLPDGFTAITPGPAYVLWLVAFGVGVIGVSFSFFEQYRISDKLGKSQLKLIVIGIGVGTVFGFLTNVIIPAVIPNSGSTNLGPFATVILISACAYAVVKHRLFDLRIVVARSVAYTLSIAVMLIGYLSAVLGLSRVVSISSENITGQRFFYATIALIFALTLPGLKSVFDRLTNKLFYRDAYDTQAVLDIVSNVIVGNVNPRKIQTGSLAGLSDALKPSYMAFLFNSSTGLQLGEAIGHKYNIVNPDNLMHALRRAGKKIIVYDELEGLGGRLKEALRIEGIGIISPLLTKDEVVGYLVLGSKKSGSIYNSQDIGLLNIASNELAVALQNAQRFDEIQAFNVTLQEKVTEATRELKLTNKKLIALDEAKDEFISMASHQLRTPLTSIKGYISMMLEGDLGKLSQQQKKALQEAYGSSQRMVFLIADFLNVSRIKTGKFVIEPTVVDMTKIVAEEITQLQEMAASRDLKLSYETPLNFPMVKLDENKIRQVIMNMVDNAIYYTPSGGTVEVQLYSNGEEAIFKVIDSGIGVPKNQQYKLFTKFFRADNAKKARPDGTGLGLFMAQKVVVSQGGVIIFESVEGKGSTFGFRFPIKSIEAKS